MSLISRIRRQQAVYWPRQPGFSKTGDPSYGAAVVITCRWEKEVQEVDMGMGKTVIANYKVYVDREMKTGDLLYLGSSDPFAGATPTVSPTVLPVVKPQSIPNLKNTETLHIAYL